MQILVEIALLYVFFSAVFFLLGLLHGIVLHHKFVPKHLVEHALRFGFVDCWVTIGSFLGRHAEELVERLEHPHAVVGGDAPAASTAAPASVPARRSPAAGTGRPPARGSR